MDMIRSGAVVTLVGLADNTTSLYISNGGGVIGNGQHESVAKATFSWLSTADRHLAELTSRASFPLPADGEVEFSVLTKAGWLGGSANEDDLKRQTHPLAPLWNAGQDVITQVRLVREA